MRKHNTIKVVLLTMLVFLLLSWIFPAAYYSGQYYDQGRIQMGLYDLFNYPMTSLSYFGYIGLYFILVGGFYGVLYKIPAYRAFLDRIAKHFEGKGMLFISLVIIVFAFAVSICGLQVAFAFFVPFVVSVILLLGYDKIVAALTVVGSLTVGLIGSTFAYSNTSMIISLLSLKYDYQIGVRFIILVVGIALLIFNIYMYLRRNSKNIKVEKVSSKKEIINEDEDDNVEEVKVEKVVKTTKTKSTSSNKSTKKSSSSNKSGAKKSTKNSKSRKNDNKAALKNDDVIVVKESSMNDNDLIPPANNESHKVWPFTFAFVLMLILMILAFVPWGENVFGIKLFDDVTNAVVNFKLFGFPIFGKILGSVNSFGNWVLSDFFVPIGLLILLIALIFKLKLDDVFDAFLIGARKAFLPAAISLLVYTILVVCTYHPFQLSMYKAILGWSKGFNIVTTIIVSILSGVFNSDMVYSAQSLLPYYASVVTDVKNYSFVAVIFQTMYGFSMLLAPTGLILMCTLSYLKVTYLEWLKNVWKLLLELFVVLLIVFIILALI